MAVIGLTKVLALEWAPHGVTVNALVPTQVYAPGSAKWLDEPDFLASVLECILTDRVGTRLVVDGGWTAQECSRTTIG